MATSTAMITAVTRPHVVPMAPISGEESEKTAVALNERDLQLLRLVFQGRSNKQIAETMDFTHGTVRVYVSQLFRRLGVKSRTAAVFAAIERGYLKPSGL
jgi:DNA-binding NarL/FixJ family response regulator